MTGGASSDTLTGNDGPNTLVGGPGLNTLDGLGGDDVLRGGEARDVILGGKGRDQLFGEGDDDSINAFDSEADVVSCGASLDDDAQVDAVDQVDGCEFASRGDVPVPVDGDGDGFVGGFDCNDANGAISPARGGHPGRQDRPELRRLRRGDPVRRLRRDLGVLQGERARAGRHEAHRHEAPRGPPRARHLQAPQALRRRCPFTRATRKPSARTQQASLTALFKRRRLPRRHGDRDADHGARSFNGRVRRITIRNGASREERLCLVAPSKTPRRCPSGEEE